MLVDSSQETQMAQKMPHVQSQRGPKHPEKASSPIESVDKIYRSGTIFQSLPGRIEHRAKSKVSFGQISSEMMARQFGWPSFLQTCSFRCFVSAASWLGPQGTNKSENIQTLNSYVWLASLEISKNSESKHLHSNFIKNILQRYPIDSTTMSTRQIEVGCRHHNIWHQDQIRKPSEQRG